VRVRSATFSGHRRDPRWGARRGPRLRRTGYRRRRTGRGGVGARPGAADDRDGGCRSLMLYWLGVAAFALAILISVSLHELGHMITAKRFGMKVTKYFVGFGPTVFSFQRGETEYGLKAIPLGGFCKIVGMTPQDDDVAPEDQPRAMWRFPVWKRTVVMSAGSVTHFLLAIVATWFAAIFIGLPNPAIPTDTAG